MNDVTVASECLEISEEMFPRYHLSSSDLNRSNMKPDAEKCDRGPCSLLT